MPGTKASLQVQPSADTQFALHTLILGVVALVPTTIFYVLGTSSQAVGVGVSASFIFVLAVVGVVQPPPRANIGAALVGVLMVLLLIVSHGVIAALFTGSIDVFRTMQSLVLLGMMIWGSAFLSHILFSLSDLDTDRMIQAMFVVFVAIGALAIAGVRPLESATATSPVFPFNEPSHYALTFTPILLAFCARATLPYRVVAIAITFIIAYLLKSLSLVVGTLLISAICLPTLPMLLAVPLAIGGIELLDLDYFTARLDFTEQNDNLSTLVFLQGWELAGDALKRSFGWGIGFQQLGFTPITSFSADRILRILGTDANLKDGGFLLAKTISEFGVFGIGLVIYYALILVANTKRLYTSIRGKNSLSASDALAAALIVGFSVEVFLRGIGYFSGSGLLFLAAVFYWRRQSKTN